MIYQTECPSTTYVLLRSIITTSDPPLQIGRGGRLLPYVIL